ncbi:hypothetical protein [Streptomyces sp. NPDC006134]|uniref:hypothetical protein n=1 Tax=Streptomyces sp. NPDC006134 TaxID=3154467 RepID=UPI0033C3C5DD
MFEEVAQVRSHRIELVRPGPRRGLVHSAVLGEGEEAPASVAAEDDAKRTVREGDVAVLGQVLGDSGRRVDEVTMPDIGQRKTVDHGMERQ